jgi:hypothetical protein
MNCIHCKSTRIVEVSSKASDLHFVACKGNEHNGYLPKDLGIGGGDYIEFSYCLECGMIQGKFPRPKAVIEDDNEEEVA